MPTGPRPDPPARSIRVAVEGDFQEAHWANVFWVRDGGTDVPTGSDIAQFAQLFLNNYAARFNPFATTLWTVRTCSALYYEIGGGIIGGDGAITQSGTAAGGSSTAATAVCISWSIQQRYRGGHPRTYLCGVPLGQILTVTTFASAYVNSLANAANDFIDDVNGISAGRLSDNNLGVVSFQNNGNWRSPPVFRDFIPNAASVDPRVDTQRRRLGPDR